ncbi:MAG: LptA/OstA family protein [Acidobacteriota bacterium]
MKRFHLSLLLRWMSLAALVSVVVLIVVNFRVPPSSEIIAIPLTENMDSLADREPVSPERELEPEVVERSTQFEAEGSSGGKRTFLLQADETITHPEMITRLLGVHLQLFQGPGEGFQVEAREGLYSPGSQTMEFRGQVVVSRDGEVLLRSETLDYRNDPPLLHTDSRVEFQSGDVRGTGSSLKLFPEEERLEVDGPVFLQIASPTPGSEPWKGHCWQLTYSAPDRRVRLRGDAALWNREGWIGGWDLEFQRPGTPGGRTWIRVGSAVEISRLDETGGFRREIHADRLQAAFGPGEDFHLEHLHLQGAARGTDGTQSFRADQADFRRASGEILFLGSADRSRRARVRTLSREINADRIRFSESGGDLHAAGNVQTELRSRSPGDSAFPFPFDPEVPVLVFSGRLETFFGGRRVLFSGGVVAWQGDRQIRADRIQLEEADGRLLARERVLTRFPLDDGEDDTRKGETSHVTIQSDALYYERGLGIAHYQGGAQMDRGDARVNADSLKAEIGPEGRRIRRVLLDGQVRFFQGNRIGEADHGIYLPEEELLTLTRDQGFVELKDLVEGRSLRGKQLTLDLGGDRMKANSGSQARIWMTLDPARGEAESVDAAASH